MNRKVYYIFTVLLLAVCVFGFTACQKEEAKMLYCWKCGKQIPAESTYCLHCGAYVGKPGEPSESPLPSPSPSPSPSPMFKGEWSQWSAVPVYASSTRQVETQTVVAGYNMVHYGTQTESSPHYRVFRNYSINGDYRGYGARSSYGEKHFTRYVPVSMLETAVTYEPGVLIEGDYAGYQKGTSLAYYFGDDKYIWFVESADYITMYRYRDIS